MPSSQTLFYNGTVQSPKRLFQRLSLGMVVLLMGLLSIGPFLHSHMGGSMVSGFHMDGVQHLAQVLPFHAATAHQQLRATHEETPVMGVATSLPNSDHDGLCVIDMTGLLTAILLVSPARMTRIAPPSWGFAWTSHTYQAGWPPPGLAPPTSDL